MLTLPSFARRIARTVLPDVLIARYQTATLIGRAEQLRDMAAAARTAHDLVDAISSFGEFRPFQKKSELVRLIELVESLRPIAICEIGAASGGTLCAMAHVADPGAVIVSVDIDFTAARLKALPQLGRATQAVSCIAGDSHQPGVLAQIKTALGGRPLDVLFIDGDHSYAGVKSDFETYRTLVRPGGMIAFHDIVADFRSRFGRPTASDSGGVPQFWQELKTRFSDAREFVEDQEQDGYGIGVLKWPG